MKRRKIALIALLTLATLGPGCEKTNISVGKGDPNAEIKQCLSLSAKGKHEDAIQCFEMFKARYPQTKEGQEAELLIGDSHFAKKDYLLAAEAYGAFLRLYPNAGKADYAHYKIGVSYYKDAPKAIDRDQAYLTEAIDHLRIVLSRYPHSEYREPAARTLAVCLRRIARRDYYIGNFYYRTGEYIACLSRFAEIAENFPESGLADKSLFLMVKANIELKRLEAAKEAFGKLSSRYSKSQYAKKAERALLHAAKKS